MFLTLLHSERPKLYTILAFLSAVELKDQNCKKVEFANSLDPNEWLLIMCTVCPLVFEFSV